MPAVKRELELTPPPDAIADSLDSADGTSDETGSSGPDDSPSPKKRGKTSPSKAKVKTESKVKASKAKKESDGEGAKQVKRVWTPEEDVIFLEMLEGLAREHLWNKVKEDGRLAYRGGNGIKAHAMALMGRLKKGEAK